MIPLPLKSKICGPVTYVKDRENICLTADQDNIDNEE